MRRLLAAVCLSLLSSLTLAAVCTTTKNGNASDPTVYTCGHVPTLATGDSVNLQHTINLDTDIAHTSDGGSNGFWSGTVTSDGNGHTITIVNDNTANLDICFNGTINLKGHDKVVCKSPGANKECEGCPSSSGFLGSGDGFLMDGTIGAEQTGTVSNVGTTFTVSGITTTGFLVGDALVWTSGNARSYWYEVTAITGTSVTYVTDLSDASSADLFLTGDEGTLGGLPSPLHSTPNVTPVTGDRFRLIAPVKFTYDSSTGGYWNISTGSGVMNAAANVRLDGFSMVNSTGTGGASSHLALRFPTTYTGNKAFSFLNLGEHREQSPYLFKGQGLSFDYPNCHDTLAGTASTGACMEFTECTIGTCGVSFPITDLTISNANVYRTGMIALSVGLVGQANNDSIVFWKPTIHDIGNANGTEADCLQCDDCDNSLVYGGRCWNVADPQDGNGKFWHLEGDGSGNFLVDSWAVNGGDTGGVALGGWTAINNYASNTNGPIGGLGGNSDFCKMYGFVGLNFGLSTGDPRGVVNCDMDGGVLITSSTQADVPAWQATSTRNSAITVRNVLAKGYKGSAFEVAAGTDQNVTFEHITCGGPGSGNGSCIDMSAATLATTLTAKDIAANSCGTTSAFPVICATADGDPIETLDSVTRDSDVCGAISGTCANPDTNAASSTDLGFTAPASNNYNISTSSVLYRAGGTPPLSSRGVRCFGFDPSRMPEGVTFDTAWTDIATEVCIDPDRDGYLTLPLGGSSNLDVCPYVTDIKNATPTCANGNTAPGKRVFP